MKSNKLISVVADILVFMVTVVVGLGLSEAALRIKNSDQHNYNIEMWRYSKLLKVPSADPEIGHEHRTNVAATLQGVQIRLNSLGMRGSEADMDDHRLKRILLLGSSNTLGWGVKEEEIMSGILSRDLVGRAQVFNAGIGNYNAHRYVRMFEKKWLTLEPDVVVVQYFIRDAEKLSVGGGNWFLRNSQLAVTLFQLFQNVTQASDGPSRLVKHYQEVYAPNSEGFKEMNEAFKTLNQLSLERHFKVILTVVPDIHAIEPYPFSFVHEHMRQLAAQYNWAFFDFRESLSRVPSPELYVMKGDPHVNGKGQKIMANALLPLLN